MKVLKTCPIEHDRCEESTGAICKITLLPFEQMKEKGSPCPLIKYTAKG